MNVPETRRRTVRAGLGMLAGARLRRSRSDRNSVGLRPNSVVPPWSSVRGTRCEEINRMAASRPPDRTRRRG